MSANDRQSQSSRSGASLLGAVGRAVHSDELGVGSDVLDGVSPFGARGHESGGGGEQEPMSTESVVEGYCYKRERGGSELGDDRLLAVGHIATDELALQIQGVIWGSNAAGGSTDRDYTKIEQSRAKRVGQVSRLTIRKEFVGSKLIGADLLPCP